MTTRAMIAPARRARWRPNGV